MQIVAASPAIPARQPIVGISDGLSSADPKNIRAARLVSPMIIPRVFMLHSLQCCVGPAGLAHLDDVSGDGPDLASVLQKVPDHLASMFCGGLSAVSYATRKRSLMLQFRALAMLTILSIFGMLLPVFQSEKTDW